MFRYNIFLFSILLFLSAAPAQQLYNETGHIPIESQQDWYKAGLIDKQQASAARLFNMQDNDGLSNPTDRQLLEHYFSKADGQNYTIIYFPAGDYYFDDNIFLTKSNIVLQGEGPDKSKLHLNKHTLYIKGTENSNTICRIQNPVNKGTNSITCTEANSFRENDWIHFYEAYFPIQGFLETENNYYRSIGQINKITNIDNNTLTLKDKASKTYDDTGAYLAAVKITPIENIGIENIKVDNSCIVFQYAVNCWVRGLESSFTFNSHMTANWCSHLELSGNYFHNADTYESGAYGINMQRSTTNCLVENNVFKRLRHAMLLQAGANCNVFAYNYSYKVRAFWKSWFGLIRYDSFDLLLHGRYPYGNLFEQNHVVAIAGDDSHNSYSGVPVKNNGPYNAFLRNWARGDARLSTSVWEYGLVFRGTPKVSVLGNVIRNDDIDFDLSKEVDIYSKISENSVSYDNWNKIKHTDGDKYQKISKDPNDSFLYDVSYYYQSRPSFLTAAYTFPSLGPRPESGEELTQNIPARERRDWTQKTYFDENYKTLFVPLAVNISGPAYLNMFSYGTFTANVSIATGLKPEYKWQVKTSRNWIELEEYEGKKTISYGSRASFILKCEVSTASNGDSQTDTYSVKVVGLRRADYDQNIFKTTLIPNEFVLRNYPNPFNSETNIQLDLPAEDYVSISVFNSLGQKIKSIVSQNLQPGFYNFKWNGKDNSGNSSSTGLYIIYIRTKNNRYTLKTLLIK